MSDNLSSKAHGASRQSRASGTIQGLPKNYGDTKIVILPRDPVWFYAYWEISSATVNQLRDKLTNEKYNSSSWILRVYDVTDLIFDGTNSRRFFDIAINNDSDNWYVNVRDVNRSWCVDLGLFTQQGEFIFVARSNALLMPRQGVSPVTDEQWAILQKEFEKLLKLSGVDQIGKSSFDIAKLMRERWEEILSVSLSSPSSVSSWKGAPSERKPKDFWLKADTELIIYGSTESDAKLTVDGQPVALYPDGSFSLRFYLPDGKKEYPIHAVSNDGTMEKKITFVVKRDTK
ncbi:MAG: DUF4912 domain-containing protein [Elusimicrobia bacterium]|nr:DUF4912 domain-containing protein [Candidatus Liberimonas magnetica]